MLVPISNLSFHFVSWPAVRKARVFFDAIRRGAVARARGVGLDVEGLRRLTTDQEFEIGVVVVNVEQIGRPEHRRELLGHKFGVVRTNAKGDH